MHIALCETGHKPDEFLKTCLDIECIIIFIDNVYVKNALNQGFSTLILQLTESELLITLQL